MTSTRRTASLIFLAVMLFSACGREGAPDQAHQAGSSSVGVDLKPGERGPVVRSAVALERFEDCSALLGHLRAAGRERVGPYGLPGAARDGDFALRAGGRETADTAAGAPAAQESAATQPSSGDFSTTNVQEESVDEPDIVKNDGRRILAVDRNESDGRPRLVYLTVADGKARIAGHLDLPVEAGSELLIAGDRAMVLGFGGYAIPFGPGPADSRAVAEDRAIAPGPQKIETVATVIDISNPGSMKVTDTLRLDGNYVSARMVGGIARLVLNSQSSRLAFDMPTQSTPEAARSALERNRKKIADAPIDSWLPHFVHNDAEGKKIDEGPLTKCDSTYTPQSFSGFGTVSVVTIDPANPNPQRSSTVLGDAGIVYASPTSLYVATQRWPEPRPLAIEDAPIVAPEPIPAAPRTEIHRFDISDRVRAIYSASGQVEGTVLNQWSMSEHEGFLRVATTTDQFSPEGAAASSSTVNVLTTRGTNLARVGSVGGIGKGERIFGVRFIGDTGYVVTFRQVDPLHVIDLSEPTRPRVLGELVIPGYSAYLHPVGEGKLLGVGQDASPEGMRLGAQVSLFDVSNPNDPKQLSKIREENASSPVEYDHHAFLYWERSSLAVVPLESYGQVSPNRGTVEQRSAAVGYRIDGNSLREIGRASHSNHVDPNSGFASIQRSIVIGDTLFTLSAAGLMSSDIDTFAERNWVAF
jgi:uncharacterized secreted protein with C-terminal beta-propeller domain